MNNIIRLAKYPGNQIPRLLTTKKTLQISQTPKILEKNLICCGNGCRNCVLIDSQSIKPEKQVEITESLSFANSARLEKHNNNRK